VHKPAGGHFQKCCMKKEDFVSPESSVGLTLAA
jgi:hypothetical protein